MESAKWKWEIIVKLITTAGILGTVIFGFFDLKAQEKQDRVQRKNERQENLKHRQFELYKAFWEKRFEMYSQVCDAASATTLKIARLAQGKEQPASTERGFWSFYYGSLGIVEDKIVADTMVKFAKVLRECEQTIAEKGQPTVKQAQLLKVHSLELAVACRDSLREYWKNFGTVDDVKIRDAREMMEK